MTPAVATLTRAYQQDLHNTNRGRNIDKRTFDAITNVHMDQPIFKRSRSKCEAIR